MTDFITRVFGDFDYMPGTTRMEDPRVGEAAIQASLDGKVVPVASGLGVGDAVDPDSSARPVQDAIDMFTDAGGKARGRVLLPPETVQEEQAIQMPNGRVDILGHGSAAGGSTIEVTGTGENGITFTSSTAAGVWDGFDLRGRGPGSGTKATAVEFGDVTVRGLKVFDLGIRGWYGPAVHFGPNNSSFELQMYDLQLTDVDAGDDPAMFYVENSGPTNYIGNINASPSAATSGSNSTVFLLDSVAWDIDAMNVGGSAGTAFKMESNFFARLGFLNYEATAQQSTPRSIVEDNAGGRMQVWNARQTSGAADYFYRISRGGGVYGRPGTGTLTNSAFGVVSDLDFKPAQYFGPASDVDNASGATLTNPVVCFDAVTKKVSTGTGYDGGTNDTRL
jgi:hypothetical protein